MIAHCLERGSQHEENMPTFLPKDRKNVCDLARKATMAPTTVHLRSMYALLVVLTRVEKEKVKTWSITVDLKVILKAFTIWPWQALKDSFFKRNVWNFYSEILCKRRVGNKPNVWFAIFNKSDVPYFNKSTNHQDEGETLHPHLHRHGKTKCKHVSLKLLVYISGINVRKIYYIHYGK